MKFYGVRELRDLRPMAEANEGFRHARTGSGA